MNILFFLTPKEDVAHVEETDTMRQVLEKMEHHGYTAIPLLGVEGKYIGTITEGDLLWFLKDRNFPDLKLLEDMPITSIERRRDNRDRDQKRCAGISWEESGCSGVMINRPFAALIKNR